MLLRNPSLDTIIALALILVVALPFHEFSHGLAAYRLGDPTAKYLGRLTLNPLAHLDPLGALMIVMVGFGWAKPTPYNPLNLRGGKAAEAIVAVAGPLSNLVLAAAAALPLRYILSSDVNVPDFIPNILAFFVYINLILMVFNLIPIPPLDGSKVLYSLMDRPTEYRWRPVLEQYGPFLLLLLIVMGSLGLGSPLTALFNEVVGPLFGLLVGQSF